MSNSNQGGLLPVFNLFAGHSFAGTVLICWCVSYVGMAMIGILGESRIIPISSKKQFLSYFPGHIFLGFSIGSLLTAAGNLPEGHYVYNDRVWQTVVLIVFIAVAKRAIKIEWMSGVYSKRAYLSPTKIYINAVLYLVFAYVAFSTFLSVLAGSDWSNMEQWAWMALALGTGAVWFFFATSEYKFYGDEGMTFKSRHAHIANWSPLPVTFCRKMREAKEAF